jgi:hypothetical protein
MPDSGFLAYFQVSANVAFAADRFWSKFSGPAQSCFATDWQAISVTLLRGLSVPHFGGTPFDVHLE